MPLPTLTYQPGRAGVVVDLERLVASRLLIQANSGGGKSRALRQLLEETHGRVPHLVIDPEGEFATLRERFDYVLAAKTGGDVVASAKTAKLLCRRLVELGASAVIDLYELPLQERREFVKLFVSELVALPRSLWRPYLVVIDELHHFAPERGSGEAQSTEAVIALATLGRKRGFALVGATQRISKLHKDCAAELLNKMIGRTGLDVDLKRAGDELGLDKEARAGLRTLSPGEFFVYGPAISNVVTRVRTGPVVTSHPEAGKVGSAPPPAPAKVKALLSRLVDLPQQAEQEARTVADLTALVKQLRGDLRRAQSGQAPAIDPAAMQAKIADAVERARAAWTREFRRLVERDVAALGGTLDRFAKLLEPLNGGMESVRARFGVLAGTLESPATDVASAPVAAPRRDAPARAAAPVAITEGLSAPQQRMLDAMLSFEAIGLEQIAKSHVAVFSGQSSRSSGFRANLSTLSAAGLIERLGGELVRLTAAGRAAATTAEAVATLEDLHDAWKAKLSGPQQLMLMVLIREYPGGVEKDELAKASGQSPLSSGYRANLSTLSSLGLLRRDNGRIVATKLLFPEGLA